MAEFYHISILEKVEKQFLHICKQISPHSKLKLVEHSRIADFVIYSYSGISQVDMMYNIKLTYEEYIWKQ